MALKKYEVVCIRWEPQTVAYEIEAENDLIARRIAKERCEQGDFDFAEIDNTRSAKVTLHTYKRIREETQS